ncbi:recombinase family protein, partial [Arthrobacter sp.]|uniref:recombinase family protein n=1 Tax=Arthrobacter sp. TaxID=1667 RepID=UPI003A918DD0
MIGITANIGNIIGYVRVGTAIGAGHVTPLDSQRKALTAVGTSRIFTDEGVSGAKASRPQLDDMIDCLGEGDTLPVTRLDRLGRSMQHLGAWVGSRLMPASVSSEYPLGIEAD